MVNPLYSQIPFNPMAPAQQRLMQMEQQFPQFAQQGSGQPQMQQVQPQYPLYAQQYAQQMQQLQQMQQPMPIKCRAVTSFDEAKAAMIDLDGSLHVFTDTPNKHIYTKQINLDGTATLNVYTREEPNQTTVVNSTNESPVSQGLFAQTITAMQDEIEALKLKFEQRSDSSVQPDANASRNTRKGTKPNDANDATNG